ncbi:unnamed protein product [Tuber aestivum]|uniref:CCHC-type domain-containing protein n=1 Tax=Tuber aestivum TaxID=59557 RepID=A0A292PQP8_9PEZI|nr:unnamed protein product [Tuber aestivum]
MDKINLVIPLLEDQARNWYLGIHAHINREAARRAGMPFNKNGPLRTWKGFRERLEQSHGGDNVNRDKNLLAWNSLVMTPHQSAPYLDKIIDLMYKLNYTDHQQVKDKVRAGISSELRKSWALMTPHPETLDDYLDLLRKVGHNREDDKRFGHLNEDKPTKPRERREKETSKPSGRFKKKEKGSGWKDNKTRKTANVGAGKQAGTSEYAIAHRDIPQTLTEKRRNNKQCTKCGREGHFWRQCSVTSRVVHAVRNTAGVKRSRPKAESSTSGNKRLKRIEASRPPPSGPKLLEARKPSPTIMEVDTGDELDL